MAEKEEMEEELLTWIGRKQKGKVERWVKEAGGGLEERKQKKLEESWNYLKRNWKGGTGEVRGKRGKYRKQYRRTCESYSVGPE